MPDMYYFLFSILTYGYIANLKYYEVTVDRIQCKEIV